MLQGKKFARALKMGAAARHLAPTKCPTSATQFWPQVESARVLICVETTNQQRMVPDAPVEKRGEGWWSGSSLPGAPAAAPHSCISWTDKGQSLSPRSGADLFAGLQVGRLVCGLVHASVAASFRSEIDEDAFEVCTIKRPEYRFLVIDYCIR